MSPPSAHRYWYAKPQTIATALLLIALSGCLDASPDQLSPISPTPTTKAAEQLEPTIIASGGWNRALGLGPPICTEKSSPREMYRDHNVPKNSTRMEATYESDGFFGIGEGFELGYGRLGVSIDDGPYTWYNMSAAPGGKVEWPILESQQEPDSFRWRFTIRNTLDEDDECPSTSSGSGRGYFEILALYE